MPHNFYQWFRNGLDNAGFKTIFKEHIPHILIAVRIIRALCPERGAELAEGFKANHILTRVTVSFFQLPYNMNHMPKQALDDVGQTNNKD